MLQELKKEANYTYTENGALTYGSTMNHCLDLFATIGGMRRAESKEIITRFIKAYVENPDVAMRILFYARDIRGGLGERRVFRIILKYLCKAHASTVQKNLRWIVEMGRFDDILVLMDTPCEEMAIAYLKKQLLEDIAILETGDDGISLLAKWLPSVNTSNADQVRIGRKLAKAFGLTEREYRRMLSMMRRKINILENHLREVDYSFDYSKQPGKAMLKYRTAFLRHDGKRYQSFLDQVNCGKSTLHTDALMPYEIIRPLYIYGGMRGDTCALDTTWNALEDYAGNQNSLVVVDGSGSMYGGGDPAPILVAHSLGLYFAEKNKGAFGGHFITFSETPRLVEVKGNSLAEKVEYMKTFCEVANTNLSAVFELILNTAVKNNIPRNELPERIIIVSDMEFDSCIRGAETTNFEYAKEIFEAAGYALPKVVFWNVASRKLQLPVTSNEQGVALVSGCSAKLFEQVIADATNPFEYMMEILNSERYGQIVA